MLLQITLVVNALYNVDHNLSSTTAKDSFHGTSLTTFGFPSTESADSNQEYVIIIPQSNESGTKLLPLPELYANVPPAILRKKEPTLPATNGHVRSTGDRFKYGISKEEEWLSSVRALIRQDELSEDDYISWAAFHASKSLPMDEIQVTINALLPLFYESAHSVAMIKHGMNIFKQITEELNPGQTPVMVVDQPLYTLAKLVQFNDIATHGADQFLVMLGGMHIEMAAMRT